ncbi:MAG TPA: MDR family MFS transporter [Candidatus Limnocylindrales bacterium]
MTDHATTAPPTRPAGVPDTTHPAIELSPRARFEVLGAILLGLLLGALDQTVVGTALPRIVTDLHGNDLYTWVVTIYLLTSTITVPFYGKLSDLYGRKPFLLGGITIFLLGSALSGLSQEMWQLILFRGIQGIGAGSLFPISLAVIGDLFTPAERGKYQGLFGAVFGLSALVGPALGGFLTDTLSWHWIFYINLPIGLLSLVVIARVLPTFHGKPGRLRDLDWAGAAVFAVGIALFLVGLTNKQTGDWTDVAVGGLVGAGLVILAVFLFIETRATEPIIPLTLFRDRTYSGSIAATFLASFGFFSAVIFLPLYFQLVLGRSATISGYEMFPLLIGVIGASIAAGQVVARTGRYKLLILGSMAVLALGSYLLTNLHADTDIWALRAWMLVVGLGIGPTLAVFTIVVQNAVPFSKLGVATSSLTFFRQIGGSVGLAMVGSYFGSQLRTNIPTQLSSAHLPAQITQGFGNSNFDPNQLTAVGGNLGSQILADVPAQARAFVEPFIPQIVKAIFEAVSISIGQVFWFGVAASLLGLVAALAIKELPLRATLRPAETGKATEGEARGATGIPIFGE